ncbi:MAG: carbonic anhydrase [Nitriliruptoraceae bacterium]
MVDVVYRFGGDVEPPPRPATGGQARRLLEQGNAAFVELFDPAAAQDTPHVVTVAAGDMQLRDGAGILAHEPFAAVLGCADARVPIELLFGRAINDLFVLRVAGNVLGSEVIGSLDYALANLPTIRLVVVLGHSSCGAVTAAVQAYLDPASYLSLSAEHQLRAIVDQLFPAVRLSHAALLRVHGDDVADHAAFVPALVEVAVAVNAAIMASSLRSELASYGLDEVVPAFGVYDLGTHRVGVSADVPGGGTRAGLFAPPADAQGFRDLADDLVRGPVVRELLLV